MNVGGWLFMLLSLAFVWGLTGYCFYRILSLPPEAEEAEAEILDKFHSA